MSSELFTFDNFPLEIEESNGLSDDYDISQIEPAGVELQNLVKTETAQNLMQRSYSSNSFDHCPQPQESHHSHLLRRVCSTGDLQLQNTKFTTKSHFKVGRYSAEERKERIDRYRAKRTLRNFNKTIKYACRKTLADTRPRVRGRFARNDEMPKAAAMLYDDDHLWIYGLLEEDGDRAAQKGPFFDLSNSALQIASYSTFYV